MKALDGVRILDMTHVQSGPTCTQLLAWFGADVIKVERPRGRRDTESAPGHTRRRQLVFHDAELQQAQHHAEHEIRRRKGRLHQLIESCDVMVENFAPGAIDRMGFPWERIQEITRA